MPLGPATGALQVPATGTVQVPDAPASGGHGCHLNNLLANAVGGAPSSPTLPTQVKRTFRSLSSVKDTGGTSGLAGGWRALRRGTLEWNLAPCVVTEEAQTGTFGGSGPACRGNTTSSRPFISIKNKGRWGAGVPSPGGQRESTQASYSGRACGGGP